MLLRANLPHSKHYFECFTYNRLYRSSLYGVDATIVSLYSWGNWGTEQWQSWDLNEGGLGQRLYP